MMPTPDNCPREWPPAVLDPLVADREIAACRASMTLERAMGLIVENAALRARVVELENDLARRDPQTEAALAAGKADRCR